MLFQTRTARLVAGSLVACLGLPAHGDLVEFVAAPESSPMGNDSLGNFSGTLSYDLLGGGLASLAITIENTSLLDGWLTALAFDGPAGTSDWTLDSGASSGLGAAWEGLAGPVDVAPFGVRGYGASISNAWTGGGSPTDGLAAGSTATFTFSGLGSESVSAADFLTSNSGWNLVLRFRGFSNGDSDKLAAVITIPTPGGLAPMLVAGAFHAGRRRRSN